MKLLIKPSVILGALAGLALGVLLLIPFIQAFACFAYAFIGAGIIVFLKKNSFVGILSIYDGAIIGALSGFSAFIASAVVMIPLESLLSLIPGVGFSFNIFSSFTVASLSLIVIPMIVIFIALMSALFNAFSGLATAYIYEKIENYNHEQGQITIDQK